MNKAPTKKNLIAAKKGLRLAQRGHNLLEKKYIALLRELKRAEKIIHEMREKLYKITAAAGETELEIFRELKDSPINIPPYNLDETTVAFDEAFFMWRKIFAAQDELAEAESELETLRLRVRRTKKRASALGNVVVPRLEKQIKYISERLEENERDEKTRFKAAF
ncbi:MAG: V-type ATP synthase subunit D [Defluviitaleaceae bacterium]|nr:V-type ATP synthase subunit D [Defluviitaleaceae bacterium]